MALRVLVLAVVVVVAASESVSHVSISFGDQEPVSYQVRPHAHKAAHRPPATSRKRPKTPSTATPTRTSARVAYPPKYSTRPPSTPRPRPEPPTTPASHTPQIKEPPTKHSRPPAKHPSSPRPRPPYRPAPPHDAAHHYTHTHAQEYTYASPYHLPARPHLPYTPPYASAPVPPYHPPQAYEEPAAPACAEATNGTFCTEDEAYPEYEIKHAIQYHLDKFNHLYADVADLNTQLSVHIPKTLDEETYLCPTETSYVRPLRAINTEGKWRVVVNGVKVHYETVTQTVRIEECLTAGMACPKVPLCYESSCLQKSIYHRFLVYDPYDQYFPFAVETFKLPASCACLLGASALDH